jgi:hypothetical protein
MAFAPLSTTTAPGTPQPSGGIRPGAGRLTAPARLFAYRLLASAALLALVAGGMFMCGCSAASSATPAISHGELVPGTPSAADLDGDGTVEQVFVDPTDRFLSISDGDVHYRSRDRWHVVQAVLGDTDHDGLTEVVALLDSSEGRHLGLFSYFGGQYRERLVTQEISPAPSSIEVVDGSEVPPSGNTQPQEYADGDVVVLVQAASGTAHNERTFLRWNGFGFTRIVTVGGH